MANLNAPYGFAAISNFNGAPYSGRTTRVWIPSTDNNAYYFGDAVKSLNNSDGSGVSGVIKITNGTDTIRGIIVGVEPTNIFLPGNVPDLSKDPQTSAGIVSIPASKLRDYYIDIIDDPDAMYSMQLDLNSTNSVASKANNNASFTVTAPTPSTNALSASVITNSTIATTNTLNLRLLGLLQIPGNGFGAFAQYVVKINQHELMGNQAGV